MKTFYIIIKVLLVLDLVFIFDFEKITPFYFIHILLIFISIAIMILFRGRKQVDGLIIVMGVRFFVNPFLTYHETGSFFAVFVSFTSLIIFVGFLYTYRYEVD